MSIQQLARKRAECAARLEHLTCLGKSKDADERRELAIAMAQAREAYAKAETEFQTAASMFTREELRAFGVAA